MTCSVTLRAKLAGEFAAMVLIATLVRYRIAVSCTLENVNASMQPGAQRVTGRDS